MGNNSSSAGLGLVFTPKITEEVNNIPIHHKCRNCGEICSREISPTSCAQAIFTRTGRNGIPIIVRSIVPNDRVRWEIPFPNYQPIDFTSERILQSNKIYVDKDPRLIPWNSKDKLYDRRSYHGHYRIADNLPRNPCGRTGVTGRGHLGS